MSMYNAIFGQNPAAGVLLAMIGQSPESVGRFRDAYVTERDGENVIAVYTRNGGGNREQCWHADDNAQYGSRLCRHHEVEVEVDGVMQTRYVCEAQESAKCACPSCVSNHRLPAAPGYVGGEDDDFDSTYRTFYFRAPDEWRDLIAGLVREGSADADWQELIAALKEPPSEPKTRPQRLAKRLLDGVAA